MTGPLKGQAALVAALWLAIVAVFATSTAIAVDTLVGAAVAAAMLTVGLLLLRWSAGKLHVMRTNKARRFTRKRLLTTAGFVATLLAVITAATGVTLARMSATRSATASTFTAGTVTLTTNTNTACSMLDATPGDTATCTLKITYGGTVSGYLGLDLLIATKAGSGGTALYTPGDTTDDLQITVSDNQTSPVTYFTPTTTVPTGVGCNTISGSGYDSTYTCYQLTDLVVNKTAFTSGGTVTFTSALTMPNSTDVYQGGIANIVLLAHATQSANQPSVSSCTTGTTCSPTGFHWS